MSETMQFDLVTPERRLASGPAKSVQIPGAEGQMTAMPGHTPVITTLRPGILRAELAEGVKEFAVTGGFAEVTAEGVSVIAEGAFPRGAGNRAEIEALLEEARAKAAQAPAEHKDMAALLVADMADLLNDMV